MEPLVPDWRTLGDPSAAATASTSTTHAHGGRALVLTPRLITAIAGLLVAMTLIGAAVFLALLPSGGSVVIGSGPDAAVVAALGDDSIEPGGAAATIAPVVELVVDVEGAVRHPGLVHVPAGARVGDALARAGGFASNADLARTAGELNLAQQVSDGLKVVVPVMGQGGSGAISADGRDPGIAAGPANGSTSSGAGPVDLNHASEAALDSLPGVGPATIAKIIAARASNPFETPDDLRARGIVGDAVFTKLKDLVTVQR